MKIYLGRLVHLSGFKNVHCMHYFSQFSVLTFLLVFNIGGGKVKSYEKGMIYEKRDIFSFGITSVLSK